MWHTNDMKIDFFLAVAILFTIMATLSEKPLWKRRALYPTLFLLVVSELRFGYSEFALIKSSFLLFTLLSPFTTSEEHTSPRLFVFAHILSLLTIISLLQQRVLSAGIISILLVATIAFAAIYDIIALKGKARTTAIQIYAIALCGGIVAGLSPDYYTQLFGIVILAVYQSIVIHFMVKNNRTKKEEKEERLHKLESRFSRQVETEARRITKGMAGKVEEIEEKSTKDPLTKAINRQKINQTINEFIESANVKVFSIALIDLDDFKFINDNYGHITGDNCLKFLSEHFHKNKRRNDLFGRFGGDEFILIMPNLDAQNALKIVDYNRREIDEKSNPHITITSGIASYPSDGNNVEELIESADASLYKAKYAGKNKVIYDCNR